MELTNGPLQAVSIAKDGCAAGYSSIIAAGGDGTVNEVLNGIMLSGAVGNDLPAFGIISIGRGNDFAHVAGVPQDIAMACDVLERGTPVPMDIGRIMVDSSARSDDSSSQTTIRSGAAANELQFPTHFPNGRYFINGVGIGFDAMVNIEATKITWAQGFLSYFIGAMKTMFFYYDPVSLDIEYNGKRETKQMIQISVMNGRRMGGAFYMTPDAVADDGLFDLCIGHAPKRREMLGIILRFMNGTQGVSPHVMFDRTQHLSVKSADGKLVVQADGEIMCTEGRQVEIECLHRAIQVIRADTE